jgi:hypothetical protein
MFNTFTAPGIQVSLLGPVDHIERVVGGVSDVDPLSGSMHCGMPECAWLAMLRELDIAQMLEYRG